MKRKLLLVSCLLFVMTMWATDVLKIDEAEFGKGYCEIIPLLEKEFGKPVFVTTEQIVYEYKEYRGIKFDRMVFNFKNSRFSEARLYVKTPSKAMANSIVRKMVKIFANVETVSCDYEDGSYFYKDGRAPVGIGRLFTISVLCLQGKWNAEVRYGPFKY